MGNYGKGVGMLRIESSNNRCRCRGGAIQINSPTAPAALPPTPGRAIARVGDLLPYRPRLIDNGESNNCLLSNNWTCPAEEHE